MKLQIQKELILTAEGDKYFYSLFINHRYKTGSYNLEEIEKRFEECKQEVNRQPSIIAEWDSEITPEESEQIYKDEKNYESAEVTNEYLLHSNKTEK